MTMKKSILSIIFPAILVAHLGAKVLFSGSFVMSNSETDNTNSSQTEFSVNFSGNGPIANTATPFEIAVDKDNYLALY